MPTAKTALLTLLLLSCGAASRAEETPFLPDTLAALPKGARLSWIAKPLSADNAAPFAGTEKLFAAGADGSLWALLGGHVVLNLAAQRAFGLDARADSFCASGKGLVFSSSDSIGTADTPDATAGGLPQAPFRPFALSPLKKARLFCGKKTLYLAGESGGLHTLWLVDRSGGPAAYRQIFASTAPVTALAEQGASVFFSAGTLVFKTAPGSSPQAVFDAGEPVLGLAAPAGKGVFFALGHGIGFFGQTTQTEVLVAQKPQIQSAEGALYIFLPVEMGVLKLENPSAFAAEGGRAKPAKEKKQ